MGGESNFFGGSSQTDKRCDVPMPPEIGYQIDSQNLIRDSFPNGFGFGAGSSAVQIEGGWDADGKGPSLWDTLCLEHPETIDDRSTSMVTCDSYSQWHQDVQLLKETGCNTYKFSLSWSRILPNGDLSVINPAGIDYYSKLIDTLILHDIEPIVVMWHFDLPTALAQKLTWKDEGIIPHFVNYARICFQKFGHSVKRWITINEPCMYTTTSHDVGMFPPQLHEPETFYVVVHNMLVAHAQTYRLYEREFKAEQNGKLGLSPDCFGIEPATEAPEDVEAAQVGFEFRFGLVVAPLLLGKYPDCVRERVDRRSKGEGREISRLPVISEEMSKLMKGTLDFIGLNHYSCEKVAATNSGVPEGAATINLSISDTMGLYRDNEAVHFYDPNWTDTCLWWLKVTPPALRSLLNRIKVTYNNPEILITENGFADRTERLEDHDRSNYIIGYLNETLKAVKLDGCNVTGYYYWGLLDGWEWASGHNITFGIFHVDRSHPEKTRTPRLSAGTLKKIYRNGGFENF